MNGTRTIDVLRRFWWIVALFAIGGAIVGGLPAPEQATDAVTRWNASHTILVSNPATSNLGYIDPQQFNQLSLFTTTGQVPERAAAEIGWDGVPADLAASVTVTADEQSGALQISTTQDSAEQAVAVADSFADSLVSYLAERQDTVREDRLSAQLDRLGRLETEISDAEDRLRREPDDRAIGAELDALARQYSVVFEEYNTLQTEQSGLILTTLERAQPVAITEGGLAAPRSRTSRAILGAGVGGVLGFGIALLLSRADRKLRSREQVEQLVGSPAHAMIPLVTGKEAVPLAVTPDRHDPLADSYRRLRSIATFTSGPEGTGTTLVVSAGPGDGKSTVSANLIAAYAEAGGRTLGVNTDFRRPTLLKKLGVAPSDIVGIGLDDITTAPLSLMTTPTVTPNMVMVDLSTMQGHSPGQLARATAALLPRLAEVGDEVVIDTSPVGATAEVLEFLPLADTVILTVRLNHTSSRALERTIDTIRALSTANLLLVLIGGSSNDSSEYYYQYTDREPNRGRSFRRRGSDDATAAVGP